MPKDTDAEPKKEHNKRHERHESRGRYSDKKNPVLRLLQKLMVEEYAVQGQRYPFKYNDVVMTLILIKKAFLAVSPLLKLNPPVVVVGDLHGQFHDLVRIFSNYATEKQPGWANRKFLFLGDYVDRGRQSLEVIMSLYCLKILYPDNFFLLRGNHETKAINRIYGFREELEQRFEKEEASNLWQMINESFTFMPLAALVGEKILCMHGGISPDLKRLSDIEDIAKPIVDPNENRLACDLLWADPMIGLDGFCGNTVRGVSVYFGESELVKTMSMLKIDLIIRAHQCVSNGYSMFAGKRMITIFSASNYNIGKTNCAAVVDVSGDGRIGFKKFAPVEGRAQSEKHHEEANEFDPGHAIAPVDKMAPTLKTCVGALPSSSTLNPTSKVVGEPRSLEKPSKEKNQKSSKDNKNNKEPVNGKGTEGKLSKSNSSKEKASKPREEKRVSKEGLKD